MEDYTLDWLLKTLVAPQLVIFIVYSIVGHIYYLLGQYNPQWFKDLEVDGFQPTKDPIPTYTDLMINLITGFTGSSLYGTAFILLLAPTHIPVDTFTESTYWIAGLKLIIAYSLSQIIFYVLHRLFHHPVLYQRYHHVHHQAVRPNALHTNYCAFIELMGVNLPTTALPVMFTQLSWFPALIWYAYITAHSQADHSGHKIKLFGIVLFDPSHHDRHHRFISGNYSSWELLDRIGGTRR